MRSLLPIALLVALFTVTACGDTAQAPGGGERSDAAKAHDAGTDDQDGGVGEDSESADDSGSTTADGGGHDAGIDGSGGDSGTHPVDAGADGGSIDDAGGEDSGTADAGPDDGGPGDTGIACTPSPAFMRDHVALDVTVDVTKHAQGVYAVKEKITVTADRDGCALTLFGEGFTITKSAAAHDYDGHSATFETRSFKRGDAVTVEIEFDVPASTEQNGWGLHEWTGNGGELTIGPFNEPYFVPLWLMVPESLARVDPAHDDNVAFDSVALSVVVPDSGWTVAGPGGPAVRNGNTWSFIFTGPTPLYALSFSASPDYQTWGVGPSASGIDVTGWATAGRRSAAETIYPAAITAVDWMELNVGPYDFGKVLALVEVPKLPGGMEHTTAIWYGSDVITPDDNGRYVVVHETVHHWWGDSVRFADWPHFWLAEGFDEWSTNYNVMGLVVSAQEFGKLKYSYRYYASEMCTAASSPLRFADDDDMVDHFNGDLQQFYVWGAAALQQIDTHLREKFSTNLVAQLAAWYARKHLAAATTEEFRDFLADQTGDTQYWNDFFNDWVFTAPCPTLQPSAWSFSGGTAQFTLSRAGGAGQDMPGIPVYIVDNNGDSTAATADLPRGTNSATVEAQVSGTPVRVVVDPDGAYVFKLKRATNWNGPAVSLSFTPYSLPAPAPLLMPDARRWVRY